MNTKVELTGVAKFVAVLQAIKMVVGITVATIIFGGLAFIYTVQLFGL